MPAGSRFASVVPVSYGDHDSRDDKGGTDHDGGPLEHLIAIEHEQPFSLSGLLLNDCHEGKWGAWGRRLRRRGRWPLRR